MTGVQTCALPIFAQLLEPRIKALQLFRIDHIPFFTGRAHLFIALLQALQTDPPGTGQTYQPIRQSVCPAGIDDLSTGIPCPVSMIDDAGDALGNQLFRQGSIICPDLSLQFPQLSGSFAMIP